MKFEDEIPKYRKKRNSQSDSTRRSDHKHIYERIICIYTFGPSWQKRCKICGRMKSDHSLSQGGDPDAELYQKVDFKWYNRRPFSIDELRSKFPNTEIYRAYFPTTETGRTIYEFTYEKVKNDD